MFAHHLMTRNIECCTLEDTAAEAAAIMSRKNCGFVPVVKDRLTHTLVGVLTDRDIALYLGKINRRADAVKVKEFCTKDLRVAVSDTRICEIEEMMEKFHLHRIPVVDEQWRLVGVISLSDLAEEAWKDRNALHPQVAEKEIAGIVESISMTD